MKQYQIMIKARGQHHEGHSTGNRSRDADFLLSEFLEKMRASGHEITVASFSADNTTQMLVGSPRDLNTLDEIYGISSNSVENETKEDTGVLADILNEIQGLREEHAHTHQTLVNFIDYEKDEDSDDSKAAKKRSKPRAKKEGGGALPPEPQPENAPQVTPPSHPVAATGQVEETEQGPGPDEKLNPENQPPEGSPED